MSAGDLPKVFDHHVQASAVAHAHDGLLGAKFGGAVQHFVEKWNERGDAFERKPLGAEITRLNDLLEDIGLREQIEDMLLDVSSRAGESASSRQRSTRGARPRGYA